MNDEISAILNKGTSLFDRFNEFFKNHEKALKDLLVKSNHRNIADKNLSLSEFHVIDCIGKNQLPNTTFIARDLVMTKGAISKIATKLLEKKLIKENRLEDNKKEVYYSLTALGKEAFEIHEKIHEAANEKFVRMLHNYTKDELRTINRFLDELASELWENS